MIYYPGQLLSSSGSPKRLSPDLKYKSISKSGDLDSKRRTPILEGTPDTKFDDEEGYYHIREGEHLLYRYEIVKTLGKGSFAQVVACRDHKALFE